MNISEKIPARNDKSPLYHLVGEYNTRIQEYEMSQNIIAPAAWMLAILQCRPSIVIEIGTSKGGLSNLLSSCTAHYGGEFVTMDTRVGGDVMEYPLYGKARFHNWDCFIRVEEIREMIERPGLCFVLCDGGNKPKEFNTFVEFLKPGDVIGAHDWMDETAPDYSPLYWGWQETHTKDLAEAIKIHALVDFMPEWFRWSAWCVKQAPK
jgi:hypothetical protein